MMMNRMMMMGMMMIIMLISLVFAYQGIMMQGKVASEEQKFHDLQANYWILDKATRDAAEVGSDLNKQLVDIKNYPSTLMELKLIGVGKILTGIYVLLFGILIALIMMPIRLGKLMMAMQQKMAEKMGMKGK